jgi:hypothetical protein
MVMSAFTRRTAVVALTVATLAVPSIAGAQTPEPSPPPPAPETTPAQPGGFSVTWEKLKRANRTVGRDLRRSKAIERVVSAVNDLVVVNREIPIYFTDETEIGPAYLPDQKGQKLGVIVFPGWFLKLENDALRRQLRGVKGLGPKRALQYANQFVVAHEIGHALVDQLKLPVTGKEEDAVDGFAAYLLTSDKRFGPLVPLSAAMLFDAIKHDDGKLGDSDFADEHSLPQQRVYQFLCWIYGSDTKRFKGIVGKDMLPRERARRCADEYRQLRSSWDQLLQPHLKEAPDAS